MPIDYTAYPAHWRALSQWIRFKRAQNQCECMGECGLHRTNPGPRRCVEQNGQPAQFARGRIILTVAHLCHDTHCANLDHLRAMCQRCHLRYDIAQHVETRWKKRSQSEGQGMLW